MAANFPNMFAYIDGVSRQPFLIGNIEFLMEDFLAKLNAESGRRLCSSKSSVAESSQQQTANQKLQDRSSSQPRCARLYDILIHSARKNMEDASNKVAEKSKIAEAFNTQPKLQEFLEKSGLENAPKERIIPITKSDHPDYEFKFNFDGCASESIKIEVKDRIIRATAKNEADDGTKIISYEKQLPTDVDVSSLKASLTSDGVLKIIGGKTEIEKAIEVI